MAGEAQAGKKLGVEGRYELVRELGRGGMGAVWLARDLRLGRQVALKLVERSLAARGLAVRLKREAKILAGLRHQNLVEVYDVDFTGPCPFLAMELLEGEDLERQVQAGRSLTPDEARRLLQQVAEALAYLHGHGVMHRDVKPANIFLCRDGRARLTDFGLSFQADLTRLTAEDQFIGSPSYVPPEVARGGEYVPASDVYQAALAVYVGLTGSNPFAGTSDLATLLTAIIRGFPEALLHGGGVPDDLVPILAECLASEPKERPAAGAALLARLASPRSDAVTVAPATVPPATTPRVGRRHLAAAALAVAALAVAVAAAVGVLATPPRRRRLPEVSALAREWILLPDGLVTRFGGGLNDPRWRLDGAGAAEALPRGEGGFVLDLAGLAPGPHELVLLDGDAVVARSTLATPATTFDGPVAVRYGLRDLELRWRLHGRGTVEAVVQPGRGDPLRVRSRDGRALVPVGEGRWQQPVTWRLLAGGRPLASGAGLVGASPRSVPKRPVALPNCSGMLSVPPVVAGGRMWMAAEPAVVVALRPTTTPAGTMLVRAGRWRSDEARPPMVRALVADGDRGALALLAGQHSVWMAFRAGGPKGVVAKERARIPGCPGPTVVGEAGAGRFVAVASGRADLLDLSAAALLASAPLPEGTPLGVVPLGAGVLAVLARPDGARGHLLVPGAGRLVAAGEAVLPGADSTADPGRPSFAWCTDASGRALIVHGVTAHLVTSAGAGGAPSVRSWPLPLPRDGWVGGCFPRPDGTFLLLATEPVGRMYNFGYPGGGVWAAFLSLDPRAEPGGAVTVRRSEAPLPGLVKKSTGWGVLRHAGQFYFGFAGVFFAVRDVPGVDLVASVPSGQPRWAPLLFAGSVFIVQDDGRVEGFELMDE